jgi:hypothetical protein
MTEQTELELKARIRELENDKSNLKASNDFLVAQNQRLERTVCKCCATKGSEQRPWQPDAKDRNWEAGEQVAGWGF